MGVGVSTSRLNGRVGFARQVVVRLSDELFAALAAEAAADRDSSRSDIIRAALSERYGL